MPSERQPNPECHRASQGKTSYNLSQVHSLGLSPSTNLFQKMTSSPGLYQRILHDICTPNINPNPCPMASAQGTRHVTTVVRNVYTRGLQNRHQLPQQGEPFVPAGAESDWSEGSSLSRSRPRRVRHWCAHPSEYESGEAREQLGNQNPQKHGTRKYETLGSWSAAASHGPFIYARPCPTFFLGQCRFPSIELSALLGVWYCKPGGVNILRHQETRRRCSLDFSGGLQGPCRPMSLDSAILTLVVRRGCLGERLDLLHSVDAVNGPKYQALGVTSCRGSNPEAVGGPGTGGLIIPYQLHLDRADQTLGILSCPDQGEANLPSLKLVSHAFVVLGFVFFGSVGGATPRPGQ